MKALVTGASRGIGRAIANALLVADAHVALAVRDPAAVRSQLTAAPRAVALPVDLRDADATETLVARAVSALGGLDVLVNCAGIVHYNPIARLSRSELMEQLEVNFVAPFVLAQHAAAHMRAAGGGAIVNVASTLGVRSAEKTAAYAATKAALISLTQSLALEFAPDNVRVNAVAPGVIDTDMVRVVREPDVPVGPSAESALQSQLDALRELSLLRRLGMADEVAEAVMYLIGAEFVTGSVLVVDGGLLLGH
jgi:NAD(P)-dependent dehydrogenase (short-subunit alcohol dehydrogenase family)